MPPIVWLRHVTWAATTCIQLHLLMEVSVCLCVCGHLLFGAACTLQPATYFTSTQTHERKAASLRV